jgi:hypothetical protein
MTEGQSKNLRSLIGWGICGQEPFDLAGNGQGSSEYFCCEHISNFDQVLEYGRLQELRLTQKERPSFLPATSSLDLAKLHRNFPHSETTSLPELLTLLLLSYSSDTILSDDQAPRSRFYNTPSSIASVDLFALYFDWQPTVRSYVKPLAQNAVH